MLVEVVVRLYKDVSTNVFRVVMVANAPKNIGIDRLDIPRVNLFEGLLTPA